MTNQPHTAAASAWNGQANSILHGDCVQVLSTIPTNTAGFVLTDPPYLVRYRDRSGRTVANDSNGQWLYPAFSQIHRVLREDAFCLSLYGWNQADQFITAWRRAGFRLVGHVVFRKRYGSSARFFQHHHEQAYLLAKGNALPPAAPFPDVVDWRYTGNRLHPTQKPVDALSPFVAAFTQPGDLVLDPFCGSGSSLVAAKLLGRPFLGIELDPGHHRTACQRLGCLSAFCAA